MSTDAAHSDPTPSSRADPGQDVGRDPFTPVARTAADILAIMPHTLGQWPKRSAVLLTSTDSEPGPCLRVDLPEERVLADELTLLEWIAELCRLLEHDPVGDRLYLALFTDGSSLDARQCEQVVDAVGEAAALSGHSIAGCWEVGPRQWFDLEDSEPRIGRDVQEIRSSAVWTALVVTGSTADEPAPTRSVRAEPERSELRVEDCRGLVREFQRRWSLRRGAAGPGAAQCLHRDVGPQVADSLEAWQRLLDDRSLGTAAERASALDSAAQAQLLVCLADPLGSDALAVSVLTGQHGRALRAWWQLQAMVHGSSHGEDFGWMIEVLKGRWDGTPDWERVEQCEGVLELLLDLLHGAAEAGPGSPAGADAEAWLWVATAHLERFRARGTRATRWLELAAEAVPGHLGVARLRALGTQHPLPSWAGDPQRSWHRRS